MEVTDKMLEVAMNTWRTSKDNSNSGSMKAALEAVFAMQDHIVDPNKMVEEKPLDDGFTCVECGEYHSTEEARQARANLDEIHNIKKYTNNDKKA